MNTIPHKLQFFNQSQLLLNQEKAHIIQSKNLPIKKKCLVPLPNTIDPFSSTSINRQNIEFFQNQNLLLNYQPIPVDNSIKRKSNQSDKANKPVQHQLHFKTTDRDLIKEKNRIAIKKWRNKRDNYIRELEKDNDILKKRALSLSNHFNELLEKNQSLNSEIQNFQSFMMNMFNVMPKKHNNI